MPMVSGADRNRNPSLDGGRAVAVGMVMAYHGGVIGLATAGYFGVDVFFVMSGFLITTLLLDEQRRTANLRLGGFWVRRARRLLPGLSLMLLGVMAYCVYLAPAGRYPGVRGDAFSVITYWSNWHFIAGASNYFSATGAPSLLTHTWSLAIEEQFYLVWPLILWVLMRVCGRTGWRPGTVVAAVGSAGAVASAAWMAYLYRAGADVSRLYYGSDTHAQSILVGVALAGWVSVRPAPGRTAAGSAVAVAAVAGLVWAATTLGSADPLTYQGGFLAVSLLAAALISALAGHPEAAVSRVFGVAPLAWLGRISYGMYLWYLPLFEIIDRAHTGLEGLPLFAARCAADVLLAGTSFYLVEEPVRRWRPGRSPVKGWAVPTAVGAAACLVVAVVAVDAPSAFSAGGTHARPVPSTAPTAAGSPARRPYRVLVVGDSTGTTLAVDLATGPVLRRYGWIIDDATTLGCGISMGVKVRLHLQPTVPPPACNPKSPPSAQWPALLASAVARYHPDVVLLAAGRWEVEAHQLVAGGPWVDITEPVGAAEVRSQMEKAVAIVNAGHAHLAIATAPCFSSGEQPDGRPWPDDSDARLTAYNDIVRSVAATDPDPAAVVDMDAIVCPGGRYHSVIDGVTVRAPDGIHYPFFTVGKVESHDPDTGSQVEAFGLWLAPRIVGALAPNSGL